MARILYAQPDPEDEALEVHSCGSSRRPAARCTCVPPPSPGSPSEADGGPGGARGDPLPPSRAVPQGSALLGLYGFGLVVVVALPGRLAFMPRAPKRCGREGCEERVVGVTYCPDHARRPPSPSSIAARDPVERARRKAVVDAWVAANGWVCPGWHRNRHPSDDLTAAHAHAVSRGGSAGPISVLCRSCNSRQALSSS